MPNKLAISNIAWTKTEDEAVYALMQQYGFNHLEIAPSRVWDNPYEQNADTKNTFKKTLAAYNIRVAAFQSLLFNRPDLTLFTTEENREALFEHLRKNIILGRELGATALVFGSPKNRIIGSLDKHTAHSIALEFFTRIGTIAQENGICFCIEPNPSIYGTDFICTTQEAIDFVKTINHPDIKLNIDLGTITANNENLEKTLLQALPFAGHFHISEPFLESIVLDQAKHTLVKTMLKAKQFPFIISIEMKAPEETERLPILKRTLNFVSTLYGSKDTQ